MGKERVIACGIAVFYTVFTFYHADNLLYWLATLSTGILIGWLIAFFRK